LLKQQPSGHTPGHCVHGPDGSDYLAILPAKPGSMVHKNICVSIIVSKFYVCYGSDCIKK